MTSVRQKKKKSRSSLAKCEENYACTKDNGYAIYQCHDCNRMQCVNCEHALHETPNRVMHDRVRLPPVDQRNVCQLGCREKNFVEVKCMECDCNFCWQCNDRLHVGRRASHQRVPLENRDSCHESSNLLEEFQSAEDFHVATMAVDASTHNTSEVSSFPVIDRQLEFKVRSSEEICEKLQCDETKAVKVVAIFGESATGKSDLLNDMIFNGAQVFPTYTRQRCGTSGVWMAYDKNNHAIIVDTEGIAADDGKQHFLLLLKVLALSHIVIFRTKSNLFKPLSDISAAYLKHFSSPLQAKCRVQSGVEKPLSTFGPACIVFDEISPAQTSLISNEDASNSYSQELLDKLGCNADAFLTVEYRSWAQIDCVDFTNLQMALSKQLNNPRLRPPTTPAAVFNTFKLLNNKLSYSERGSTLPDIFPDLSCTSCCLACGRQCQLSVNHKLENVEHAADVDCVYKEEYDNKHLVCKACLQESVSETCVFPKACVSEDSTWFGLAKYAWSGYVLECSVHGEIYRSRRHWYGNVEPTETCVVTKVQHVWSGEQTMLKGGDNAARLVLDSMNYVSDSITNVSSKPTRMLTDWLADQIAPSYWVANHLIMKCEKCCHEFEEGESKHHCRACGLGFCEDCSSKRKRVPERGWGDSLVRVCDTCFQKSDSVAALEGEETRAPRLVGELFQSTMGALANALETPLELIKESARPGYWVPDGAVVDCCVCGRMFDSKVTKHHCRACGRGVCNDCSPTRMPVPSRGWDQPVRVCNLCTN